MLETISYGISAGGWTTRWSYRPEWAVSQESKLYTFKGGDIYVHNSTNVNPAEFYGVQYESTVTIVFNDAPDEVKFFKTINIGSDDSWDVELFTDLSTGYIGKDSFILQEGFWYSHIMRLDSNTLSYEDVRLSSTQGVGVCQSYGSNTITFSSSIDTSTISVGDKVHKINGGAITYLGTIQSYTAATIVLASPVASPTALDFILVSKNKTVESNGARGYFMEVKLTNDTTEQVEIFSVGTEVFKSNQ